MSWPTPQPGLVIRYSYLWKREADAGREEGVKDRPCAVVVAIEERAGHNKRVIVLPITHSPPQPPDEGIELPRQTQTRLGLDDDRSWVIVSEGNDFAWPGPDLRFLPGHEAKSLDVGGIFWGLSLHPRAKPPPKSVPPHDTPRCTTR